MLTSLYARAIDPDTDEDEGTLRYTHQVIYERAEGQRAVPAIGDRLSCLNDICKVIDRIDRYDNDGDMSVLLTVSPESTDSTGDQMLEHFRVYGHLEGFEHDPRLTG